MRRKKPLVPQLPGKFGQMTHEELDAESDQYDVEFSAMRAPPALNRNPHPRKRGRPRKPQEQKSARVLITMEPRLLAAADADAERRGLTRAGLIQQAVQDWLIRQPRRRKSA